MSNFDPGIFTLASYLRKLATAVENGDARGRVAVTFADDHLDSTVEWKDGNGYTENFSGGERYTITLETVRHLNIVRCLYCGHSHPVGKCSCDK